MLLFSYNMAMNILKPKKIEDLVTASLIHGEQMASELLGRIQSTGKNITKQGFYAALRKLKTEETILIYKGRVSLNTVWIKKMRDMFEIIDRAYTMGTKSFDVLGLENKESITYSFSTIRNLDIFWGHSQNILIHNTDEQEPVYAYDPHYWFYIARKDTERELLRELERNKRQFLMTVSSTLPLDKTIKTDFNTDYLQYNYENMFDKNNYYVTVIGDYITEVFLDETTAQKIEGIYESATGITESVTHNLKSLLELKVKSKIKISRNQARAEKLKKKMGKDFYVLNKRILTPSK